ncbi:MAG: aldo/keto reductase [Verrucomicrobiae bacterium]|nr:aldo/keto reductase [Verrucomicrobiae bacterium]
MERVFGKTGWRVTEIGLGCWQFGGAITLDGRPDGWPNIRDEDSVAAIQRAVELGINFFDTSDQYGWGRSEEILGRTLRNLGVRDRVYIATKVGFGVDAAGRRTFKETRAEILAACDASLRRLQTDRIDLYQCHLWRTERWTEFLDAFEQLQKAGKIRAYGVSTNDLDMVQRFDERRALAAVQSNYNLLDRRAEREILPYCRARGIAFIARGPLAMGKLSGKYRLDSTFHPDDIRNRWLATPEARAAYERDLALVERLRPVADKAGMTLAQLAIKFVLQHVAVSVVIPGARNRQQVEQNFAAGVLPPLTPEERAAIETALSAN